MLKHLEALCRLCGTSGNEQDVRAYIQQTIGDLGTCTVDPLGNLLVLRKGRKRPEKTLMLSAHMDEVGMIVTSIRSDGSLTFGAVGGVDPFVMIGRQVLVGDATLPGVIGAKAVHKLSSGIRHPPVMPCPLTLVRWMQSRQSVMCVPGISCIFCPTTGAWGMA